MPKKLSERDLVHMVEYRIVERLVFREAWAGKATGAYVPTGRVKMWFKPELRGYVDSALEELRKKHGFVREYKGGETVALDPGKSAEIRSALKKYMTRHDKIARKYGLW